MTTRPQNECSTAAILLRKLCSKITGLVDDAVLPHYQHALRRIGSNIASPMETDEFQVAERIKRRLVKQGREKDAAIFSELHRKLQAQTVLRRRWAILYMMFSLSEDTSRSKVQFENSLFGRSLPSYTYATSTPFHGPHPGAPGRIPGPGGSTLQSVNQSSESSGISSIHRSQGSNDPTPVPQSFMPSLAYTPGGGMMTDSTAGSRTGLGLRLATLSQHHQTGSETALAPQGWRSAQTAQARITVRRGDNTSFEIPESEMIRDLVYIFQGIEGKWIKFDNTKDGYRVDADAGIPKALRQLVSKLAELGWLYSKTKRYVEARSADKAFGLVGQSFCAAFHQELTEYYRLIAVLEAQLHQEQDEGIDVGCDGMTLRRLVVWAFDPLVRLKALAALVDVCKGKKGGALCSAIHSYMQHGDPYVKSLVKHILTMVAQPVYVTLIRWAYDGELEDTYHEFFVASDPTVKDDRLWVDKYSTRKSMIPTFMTADQARKFLLTGKSINFLRQVCHDRSPIKGREAAMGIDMSQGAESMFSQDMNSVFEQMIESVYKETSQHLLHVLHTKYKFLDHLKAMRRYLLLGQGDFIRHLMDLLEEDLAKPAGNLYLHNLTGILETAIRATNAQFDDAEILKRLDVRLLEVSPGDTGWDVFSLDYHVDGPIRTVFTPECIIMYLRVFNFLWRAKRMEYILAMIWKNQMSMDRIIIQIPELLGVKHQCHILACEMVHFIQQVQYYINFEVLECSWDELLTKVQEAEDLDYIIAAHEIFLDTINARCLLDTESRGILTQLRTIFDLIIQFQSAQSRFYNTVEQEVNARQHFTKQLQRKTADGDWGMTEEDERVEEDRKTDFLKSIISSTRPQLQVLATSYRDMVQEFIVMVTTHQDASLRFLSFRLDFNQHYKARESKLRSPLTYERHKQRVA